MSCIHSIALSLYKRYEEPLEERRAKSLFLVRGPFTLRKILSLPSEPNNRKNISNTMNFSLTCASEDASWWLHWHPFLILSLFLSLCDYNQDKELKDLSWTSSWDHSVWLQHLVVNGCTISISRSMGIRAGHVLWPKTLLQQLVSSVGNFYFYFSMTWPSFKSKWFDYKTMLLRVTIPEYTMTLTWRSYCERVADNMSLKGTEMMGTTRR